MMALNIWTSKLMSCKKILLLLVLVSRSLKILDERQNYRLTLKKASSRRHFAQKVNDPHFADDLDVLFGKKGDAEILL